MDESVGSSPGGPKESDTTEQLHLLSFSSHCQSHLTLWDPLDCNPPGSSMGFSRQDYWSVLLFPSP